MAHVELPQEELDPLIQSFKRIFDPLISAVPALSLIPEELKRIGDKLEQDMMSGVPERMENVAEKFSMNFGAKMLAIYDKTSFKAQKFQEGMEQAKKRDAEAREKKLMTLRERGLAVEMKNNKVQFISEKDLQKKQAENLKTQKLIITKEKEIQKLIEKNEKGSEQEIANKLDELVNLQKQESGQSEVLGDKRKDAKQGIGAKIRGGVDKVASVLPGPLAEGFLGFTSAIGEAGSQLASFGKPFMLLGKFANKQLGITDKLNKLGLKDFKQKTLQFGLDLKKFALDKTQFALDKLMFALDKLAILTNPFVLLGIAIVGLIATLVAFGPQIQQFFMDIIDSIASFFTETIPNFFKDLFDDIYMAIPSFLGGASDEEEAEILKERGERESAIDPDKNPMQALNKSESADDKLARLKTEQSEMEREKIASNIVNVVSDNTTQTSVAVNPTVPKSTSDDAQALNNPMLV